MDCRADRRLSRQKTGNIQNTHANSRSEKDEGKTVDYHNFVTADLVEKMLDSE